MKKRVGHVWLFFLLALVITPSVIALFPQKALAANSNADLDMKRRKLHTFAECIQREIDANGDNDLSQLSDLYRPDRLSSEYIVVGLDRDGYNGVMSCSTVVSQGVHAYDPSVTDTDAWFLQKLTGYSDFRTGKLRINLDKARALKTTIQNAEKAIDAPSDALRRARLVPLANVCYDIKATAEKANADFQVKNVGFFYRKSADDIRAYVDSQLHINKNNGGPLGLNSDNIELGKIDLGRYWGKGWEFNTDFYPIGNDISQTNGYLQNQIIDCDFVKGHQPWLFEGYTLKNGKLVDDKGNAVGTGSASSTDGTGGNAPDCSTSGGGLSWIICPIIDAIIGGVDFIYRNVFIPLLFTEPVNISSSDPIFKTWSSFRTIANILLVIFLLIAVYGQATGGGLIDAYTAKKILPRVVAAAILVNISIYLAAGAIDITNIVGKGIAQLIYLPFAQGGGLQFNIDSLTSAVSLVSIVGGLWAAVALGGPFFSFLLLFVLLPALIALVGALFTIVIRQALIVFLIMVSPIAFTLYCLPNTEQYFKKWWDLFFKALLVFPIVMAILAMSLAMPTILNASSANDGPVTTLITGLTKIVFLILPLFLIPFAFKIAGGAIGTLYGTLSGWGKRGGEFAKGNANDPYSKQNITKRELGNRWLREREKAVGFGIDQQKSDSDGKRRSFGRRALGGTVARVAGGGNYQVRRSLRNKEAQELVQNQVSSGDDSFVRALFARQVGDKWVGTNGKEYSQYEVDKARSLFGKDESFYQAALTYEVGKAGDDTELGNVMAANAANMRDDKLGVGYAAGAIWTGTAFNHAQSRRELKHTAYKDGAYELNHGKFTREIAETVNNWSLGNMRTSTIKALQESHDWAQRVRTAQDGDAIFAGKDAQGIAAMRAEADQVITDTTLTATSLNQRRQNTGSFAMAGEEGSQQPVSGSQSGAAGRVDQELNNFINQVLGPPNQQRNSGGNPQTP